MAEILLSKNNTPNKPATKKLHIDMTPLVDLGFLLITFFIFTASITEAKALKLIMPASNVEGGTLGQSNALTVLASGGDTLYYYVGKWEKGSVKPISYDVRKGLGDVIRKKQEVLDSKKSDLMVIIKPGDRASYANLVNLLDEVVINDIKKYVVAPLTAEEKAFLAN
jgi:biopolymer transport protein ExbD